MNKLALSALVGLLVFGCSADPTTVTVALDPPPLEVVGYLPAYKIRTIDPLQVRHLTDLVYFSLRPTKAGTIDQSGLSALHRIFLRKVRQDYGVKVLIGITDQSKTGALATISSSPVLRARFAANLVLFLETEGFDGADFDWEYPALASQVDYARLLEAVHGQFAVRGLKLTVAVSPARPLVADAYQAVDRVHGMLYDDWGQHSTLAKTEAYASAMVAQGIPASKLLLGVPFYGRGYTASGPAWTSAVSYKTLRQKYALTPDQDTVSGYYFNGVETVRRKVAYAEAAGFSGVMVWEIGQDTNDASSLLAAISAAKHELSQPN